MIRFDTKIGQHDLNVRVVFEFQKGEQGDDTCGPVDERAIIHHVFVGDMKNAYDIEDLLKNEVLNDLEDRCLLFIGEPQSA